MRAVLAIIILVVVAEAVDAIGFHGHYRQVVGLYITHEFQLVTSLSRGSLLHMPNLSRYWKIPLHH